MKTYKVYFYSVIAVLLAVYLYLVRVSLLMASHGSISAGRFLLYGTAVLYLGVHTYSVSYNIFYIIYESEIIGVKDCTVSFKKENILEFIAENRCVDYDWGIVYDNICLWHRLLFSAHTDKLE